MTKLKILFICFLFQTVTFQAQVISISAARALAVGTPFTVRGMVTHGGELGVAIRYFQDATGGLAAYSAALMGTINIGDSIEITGPATQYNNLLEMAPATVTVISSNNPLPTPIELTSAAAFAEAYEGMLVKVTGVMVTGVGTFSAGTSGQNYKLDNSTVTQARILPTTDIAGKQIPPSICNITGIMSQFSATAPASGYQLLPRSYADFDLDNGPKILTSLLQKNITTSTFDVVFTTQNAGSTTIKYGITPALELGAINDTIKVLTHSIKLSGLQPATIYYVKAITLKSNGDSSVTAPVLMSTASLSSGTIKVIFNRDVRNAVATFTNALYCYQGIDDTIINYINRAKSSIDIAMYNWNNSGVSDITAAVNDAYARGVKVRLVYDGGNANIGLGSLNAAIGKIASPQGSSYSIMHDKFVIIDANSANPNDPLVFSGSTNWTSGQLNSDANNQVIIQDQSLARAYTLEFEEMFGSTGLTPNSGNARFGQFKTNNTPHQFMIGGKQVEQYFSPSDNVTQQIITAIKSANTDLFFQILTFTRRDVAQAIAARASAGVFAAGMIDDTANGSAGFNDMKAVMGGNVIKYQGSGILHHKLVVVDANNYYSDPQVVTGSHNWSTSADTKNDENTLVIHDADLANQYFQEFAQQSKLDGIPWGWGFANFKADSLTIKQYHTVSFRNLSVFNDAVPTASSLTWNFGDGQTSSLPNPTHTYLQSGKFTVRLIATNGTVIDTVTQTQLITVTPSVGISPTKVSTEFAFYPNPVNNYGTLKFQDSNAHLLKVYNILGDLLFTKTASNEIELNFSAFSAGVYIINIDQLNAIKFIKD